MTWDLSTLGSVMAISAQCVVVAVALRCSDWSLASPRRVRSPSQRCSVATETAQVETAEPSVRHSASSIDLDDRERLPSPTAASVVQRRNASTSPRPSTSHSHLPASCRIALGAVRSCRSPESDDPSASGSKTARARLFELETPSQQVVPQYPSRIPTEWPAADERLQHLVRQVQLFPRSLVYWAALRSYLREKEEKETLAGQALQNDLPVVCFSEDPELVAIQVEVRRRIAREGQRYSPSDRPNSEDRSSPEAPTVTRSGGTQEPHREPNVTERCRSPGSDNLSDSDGAQEDPEFQQQYDRYCQRQRRKPRKLAGLPTSSCPYDCLRVSSESDPDEPLETLQQHHRETFEYDGAAVAPGPCDDGDRVPEGVGHTENGRDGSGLSSQRNVAAACPLTSSLIVVPQGVAEVPRATAPASSEPTSRIGGGESGNTSLLTFRRLQALQQHASYARLALDPAHQGFVKELRRFEAQLRLAADKETSSVSQVYRRQSDAPGSANREKNHVRLPVDTAVPAASAQRTSKGTHGATTSCSPEQVESWRTILRRSSQQLTQQQQHGAKRRHRTPSPVRASPNGAEGEPHSASPPQKQAAAPAAASSTGSGGEAAAIPVGENAKPVPRDSRRSSFAASQLHAGSWRGPQPHGASDVNGGSTRVFARTDSYIKVSGNGLQGQRKSSTAVVPPLKATFARSTSGS